MYTIRNFNDYTEAYRKAKENPEEFWSHIASNFKWQKPWSSVVKWNFNDPEVRWFDGARLNITENCLDRHLQTSGNKPAILWEPNDPEEPHRMITYHELHDMVIRFAGVLLKNGVQKGDRVCIYMGMVPELAVAVLACARIGAIHSVIFGGFSAQSVADRLRDASAEFIITADAAYRGSKTVPLKEVIDDALVSYSFVKKVIVLNRANLPVSMIKGRDIWWNDEIDGLEMIHTEAESMEAEDPLFILYTSGSTGKPKGVVHTCAGYMVWANYTFRNIFQYQPGEIHFCTADIGWITGHSYIIYGPLLEGATTLMFEGIPTWPDAGRFWDIVDKYNVNILYTAPTAIRSLMSFGNSFAEAYKLDSLRVLGTVGEPINEEAWHWYHEFIGKKRCPIVDTWWQTETGGIMISNLAGVTPSKPCYATFPFPGVDAVLLDENGQILEGNNVHGNLCIRSPWPGMLRTTWGDHERCRKTYFSTYPGYYFTGDGCLRDAEGLYRLTGRVDDVLNVSGHRLGTAEIENAVNMHTGVIESAVVGYPHDIKGQGIYAFVILDHSVSDPVQMSKDILKTVDRIIGPIARPDKLQIVQGLPKTRSGKIMRRILRKIAEGDVHNLGDTTTLLDPDIVDSILRNRI
jgi:acetyl-CoA synthetase